MVVEEKWKKVSYFVQKRSVLDNKRGSIKGDVKTSFTKTENAGKGAGFWGNIKSSTVWVWSVIKNLRGDAY